VPSSRATRIRTTPALNLSWTLYDFGNRGGHIRSARYLLDAAAATTNYTVQQTCSTWFRAITASWRAMRSSWPHRSRTTPPSKAGHRARASRGWSGSLRRRPAGRDGYDQAVLARVLAEQAAETARATLAVVIGVPADQPLKLDAQPVPAWSRR